MTHRIIHDLRRALAHDSEVLDRTGITKWLMQFSSELPLELHHPRMGKIHYSGIAFSGSPVDVFDRFVLLSIEDLVEKHVHATEAAMADVETALLQQVATEAAGLIVSARMALENRAAQIKATLMGQHRSGNGGRSRVPLRANNIDSIPVMERLNARAAELTKARAVPNDGAPMWGWLERFAKANPALSNLISFIAGAVSTLIGAFLSR